METITTYKSEDGKETLIAEMNNFHLVNALLKLTQSIATWQEEDSPYHIKLKQRQTALKAEVLKRLNPEPKE